MIWVAVPLLLILVGVLVYWQFIIAEGTYLGPKVVTLLYNWSAKIYERIKQYQPSQEQFFLGIPLARTLELVPAPLVLDVGTGTGRLPRALLFQPSFRGRVIALDLSRRMLEQAVDMANHYAGRLTLIWDDARDLPFPDDAFDAVSCLEVIEFTPNPKAVMEELVRVLRPGGVLLLTNRVGRDAPFMPGRTFSRPDFKQFLRSLPLEDVRVQSWQLDYDLAWAIKTGVPQGGGLRPLPDLLRCHNCDHTSLSTKDEAYVCCECGQVYPVGSDGIIELARR